VDLGTIRTELDRRRQILIDLAHDLDADLDPVDRRCVTEYFERGEVPPKPADVPALMRTFFAACCGYFAVRNHLRKLLGGLLDVDTLGEALSLSLGEPAFTLDETWTVEGMVALAERLQQRDGYDLSARSLPVQGRITAFLLTGTQQLGRHLDHGLEGFYGEVESACDEGADAMWRFVSAFSKPIRFVGPALVCDFLKNSGFVRFVKVDHHLGKEFPALLGEASCARTSAKKHFARSIEMAENLGMSPFHLDHLLYQWGHNRRHLPAGSW